MFFVIPRPPRRPRNDIVIGVTGTDAVRSLEKHNRDGGKSLSVGRGTGRSGTVDAKSVARFAVRGRRTARRPRVARNFAYPSANGAGSERRKALRRDRNFADRNQSTDGAAGTRRKNCRAAQEWRSSALRPCRRGNGSVAPGGDRLRGDSRSHGSA